MIDMTKVGRLFEAEKESYAAERTEKMLLLFSIQKN